jgi:hypothetical protein
MTDIEDNLLDKMSEAQQVDNLKKVNDRLLRQVAELKNKSADLVEAAYQAILDGVSLIDIPPVKAPKPDRRTTHEETAVVVLSDWQLAKTTATYDSEICEARIELLANKVFDLVAIQRAHHPVKNLHIWCLGDIIESELIFPGQAHLIDSSIYRQITVDGPRIMTTFIRRMLTYFENIHVVGVIGNHGALAGRARKEQSPETNGDRMLYRICQQILAGEKRVTWNIPDGAGERNWYAVDTIGSYSTLLVHGDQFRGTSGMPWYSIQKKVGGWKLGAVPHKFEDVFFGHYHQPTRLTLNNCTARCSGSTESHNDWAAEQLGAVGRPSQWLLFVHPNHGVTAEYCVWLDNENIF